MEELFKQRGKITREDTGISAPGDVHVSAGQGDVQPVLTGKLVLF